MPGIRNDKRVIIGMIDGFDTRYLHETPMPAMKRMMRAGVYKSGKAIFPTLTNANNISIACGEWPETHGVTTNCYYDAQAGVARFLESSDFLLAPTIFDRAADMGVTSALLTCKSKTAKILGQNTEISIAAEEPTEAVISQYGRPPQMYSCEINYWLWEVAIDLLTHRPDIGLIYVHTTDYPMHMWPPEATESRTHLMRLDELIDQAVAAAPEASVLITADHGMNPKTRCWDLSKACQARGFSIQFAVSPVADRLLKHHRGFGGVSFVYLHRPEDVRKAKTVIESLEGIESVLTRDEAAGRFRLMAERIGDLVVLPDIDTVFGDLESEKEVLDPSQYRSHGSLYETNVPLLAYNAGEFIQNQRRLEFNLDLTRGLFR